MKRPQRSLWSPQDGVSSRPCPSCFVSKQPDPQIARNPARLLPAGLLDDCSVAVVPVRLTPASHSRSSFPPSRGPLEPRAQPCLLSLHALRRLRLALPSLSLRPREATFAPSVPPSQAFLWASVPPSVSLQLPSGLAEPSSSPGHPVSPSVSFKASGIVPERPPNRQHLF